MAVAVPERQTVDGTARVQLPEQFANSTVTVRAVSQTAVMVELSEVDEGADGVPPLHPLSNRDRDFLLNLLDNPPEPNEVLKRAFARYKERYG